MNKSCLIGSIAFFLLLLLIILIASCSSRSLKSPKLVAEGNIISENISRDGKTLNYFGTTKNAFFRIDLKKQKTQEIYTPQLGQISNLFWAPDNSKVIATTSREKSSYIIDFNNQRVKNFDPDFDSAVWQSDSQKFIYHSYNFDTGKSNLVRVNADGSSPEILTTLGDFPEYHLSISDDNSKILYYTPPSDIGGTNLHIFDIASKNTLTPVNNYTAGGAIILGNKIVYEKKSPNNSYELIFSDFENKNPAKFDLVTTLDKISPKLSDKSIVLAVPSDESKDDVYKVNPENLATTKILESKDDNNFQIFSLDVSNELNLLSFINSKGLYLMNI